jgi:hypothetical protein
VKPTAQIPDKRYTQKEREDILRDVLDPHKTQVVCAVHNYVGKELPPSTEGCKKCWTAWYWFIIATTPPHLRKERLEAMYRAVYDGVKAHERGEFDFEPFALPGVEITKGD